jgi:alpha-galactosidase
VIGVDDSERGGGTVVFEVWLDGRLAYKSNVLRSELPPESIRIDITGVKTLQLVVTDGGDGISGDHGDWAGTTLTKAP